MPEPPNFWLKIFERSIELIHEGLPPVEAHDRAEKEMGYTPELTLEG